MFKDISTALLLRKTELELTKETHNTSLLESFKNDVSILKSILPTMIIETINTSTNLDSIVITLEVNQVSKRFFKLSLKDIEVILKDVAESLNIVLTVLNRYKPYQKDKYNAYGFLYSYQPLVLEVLVV